MTVESKNHQARILREADLEPGRWELQSLHSPSVIVPLAQGQW